MSNDKIGGATSSSDDKGSKAELPDRDMYLRIKPVLGRARTPYVLNCANSSFHEITILGRSFRFKEIFDQHCSQTEVFDTAIRRRVIDFIKGKSSTILTYGGFDTGKQYTLYGTIENPGIIYHTMRLLFSMVCCTAEPWYSVDEDNQIVALSEQDRGLEVQLKREVLDPYTWDDGELIRQFLSNRSSQEHSAEMGLSSVWISVLSAVDGLFYDLFADELYPQTLFVRKDNSYFPRCPFVYVTTAAEACQLLLGVTARRHTRFRPDRPYIFTIKLLKYLKEYDVDTVSVSTLTFCNVTDDKTFNFDEYIKAVYKCGDRGIWPMSQSILMSLFKKPLLDQEAVTFLITMDVDTHYISNTMGILKTSTMIKKY